MNNLDQCDGVTLVVRQAGWCKATVLTIDQTAGLDRITISLFLSRDLAGPGRVPAISTVFLNIWHQKAGRPHSFSGKLN